jgi:hypothetical protein
MNSSCHKSQRLKSRLGSLRLIVCLRGQNTSIYVRAGGQLALASQPATSVAGQYK